MKSFLNPKPWSTLLGGSLPACYLSFLAGTLLSASLAVAYVLWVERERARPLERVSDCQTLLITRLAGIAPTSIITTNDKIKVIWSATWFGGTPQDCRFFDEAPAYLAKEIPWRWFGNSFDRDYPYVSQFRFLEYAAMPEPQGTMPFVGLKVRNERVVSEVYVRRYSVAEYNLPVISRYSVETPGDSIPVDQCHFACSASGSIELSHPDIQEYSWALVPASSMALGCKVSDEARKLLSLCDEADTGYFLLPLTLTRTKDEVKNLRHEEWPIAKQ